MRIDTTTLNVAPGEIRLVGPFDVPGIDASRHARVYVPRGYATSDAEHPLLVMFDGQNVFDDFPSYAGGWHLHEAVERFARKSRPAPVVVGVDHGGVKRIDELSPFPGERNAGLADRLVDWIADALVPSVRARLRVPSGPRGVVIGGSSMGGLASFYAHLRRPDVFGGAMAMSPSFWVAGGKIFEYAGGVAKPWTTRVYLDCGAREGRGAMLRAAERMAALLRERGWSDADMMWRPDARGGHSEVHWRRRAPKALRFLFRSAAEEAKALRA